MAKIQNSNKPRSDSMLSNLRICKFAVCFSCFGFRYSIFEFVLLVDAKASVQAHPSLMPNVQCEMRNDSLLAKDPDTVPIGRQRLS
jgi:hypothetical protein